MPLHSTLLPGAAAPAIGFILDASWTVRRRGIDPTHVDAAQRHAGTAPHNGFDSSGWHADV
jgi:hypothetical protein